MTSTLERDAGIAIALHRVRIIETMAACYAGSRVESGRPCSTRERTALRTEATGLIDYFVEALTFSEPLLLADYLRWSQVVASSRAAAGQATNIGHPDLCTALRKTLPAPLVDCALRCFQRASSHLAAGPSSHAPGEARAHPLAGLARGFLAALLSFRRRDAEALIERARDQGAALHDVYLQVLAPCLREVGRLWQENKISVAKEHYVTACTRDIMARLCPVNESRKGQPRTVVATCVAGEHHEVGLRMVGDLLEADGWRVLHLGANTPDDAVLQTLREYRAHALAVSVTMVPHLKQLRALIGAVQAATDMEDLKIVVGGHPFNLVPDLWRTVGADGYAPDAGEAGALFNNLVPQTT